ncbi:AAA family ATPase [Haloarchaeobius amylolyticus]|uniref:AAA family ATPase n=1 Tax=Haloarchaeobius amylolyticus TaxID=1198296 RepID=UPI00226EF9E7|nr:AAA family ATPase [Haloarchaeobius amylolyticus]
MTGRDNSSGGDADHVAGATPEQWRPLRESPLTGFGSIDGLEERLRRLEESVVEPARDDRFAGLGASGVLIYGPSGVGKSRLARAIIGEMDFPYLQVTPSDLSLGDPDRCARELEGLVSTALDSGRCVLLFESFDTIAPGVRSDDHGRPSQIATALRAGFDRIDESDEDVVVIAVAQRLADVERAVRRAGRIDLLVGLERPTEHRRRLVLHRELAAVTESDLELDADRTDVDLQFCAELTGGLSTAELVVATEHAARIAVADAEDDTPTIDQDALIAAFETVARQRGVDERSESDAGSRLTDDFTFGDPDLPGGSEPSWLEDDDESSLGDLFGGSDQDDEAEDDDGADFEDDEPREPVTTGDDISFIDETDTPDVTFDDIGDLETAKQRLQEVVEWPRRYPDRFEQLGIDPATGILLHGPPGTGKTMLARAVANETDSAFIPINGPEVFDKYFGESERFIREVFSAARDASPTVVFFDEFDSIAPSRGGYSDGSSLTDSIVNQLLSELDGMNDLEDVVVMAATNRPDMIDPALRRPGRFDVQVEVSNPDRRGRREVFKVHTADRALADDVDPEWLAARTDDAYSGADIAAVCDEAAMIALRTDIEAENDDPIVITRAHFEQAIDAVDPTADLLGSSSRTAGEAFW